MKYASHMVDCAGIASKYVTWFLHYWCIVDAEVHHYCREGGASRAELWLPQEGYGTRLFHTDPFGEPEYAPFQDWNSSLVFCHIGAQWSVSVN